MKSIIITPKSKESGIFLKKLLSKLTDVSKLHTLSWHHQIEIEEGIEKMFHWYAGQ